MRTGRERAGQDDGPDREESNAGSNHGFPL
jgi:hypothetical protein